MNNMKIAYLILAHADPTHLARLVNAIDYRARIFVHVDKKSDIKSFEFLDLPPSASLIKEREAVYWGGLSMVKATINLIKAALNSGEVFSHLVLLSGQDYPIKSPSFIYKTLTSNLNKQFIRYCEPHHIGPGNRRIREYWMHEPITLLPHHLDEKLRKLICRAANSVLPERTLKGFTMAVGSQWWALTPECASYAVQLVETNKSLLRFFSLSHAPDEVLFHTIVANSQFSKQTEGFIQKVERLGQLAPLHITKIRSKFSEKDFDKIKKSEFLFIRKVSSKQPDRLLDLIDEEILDEQKEACI
ncbi:hypothetical protein C7271_12100 [filamentous cyanobacterium CCP5]|nr:hypothetical protein C7271_12100 [filamentous cyanobacterium CCP5]